MKFNLLLTIVFSLLITQQLMCQGKFELASINYSSTVSSKLDNIPAGMPLLENFKIGIKDLEIKLNIPLVLSDKLILTLTPYYDFTKFSYENDDAFPGEFSTDAIHKIQLGTSLTLILNETWTATLFNNPNLSSDFRESSFGDDLFNQPGLIFSKKVSKKFRYGFGLVATFVFGKQQVFPILTLKYLSESEKLFADVTFPNGRIAYAISKKLEVGAMLKLRGNEYNYINLPVQGSTESTDFIKFSNILFGPELTINLADKLALRLSGGINSGRKFEIFDTDRNLLGNVTPKSAGFFSAGLVFQVPTN